MSHPNTDVFDGLVLRQHQVGKPLSSGIKCLSNPKIMTNGMDRGFKRGIFPFLERAVDESDLSEVGKGLRVTKS